MGDFNTPYALREPKIAGPYEIKPGDRLLAASDGVFDLLTSSLVNQICRQDESSLIPRLLGHVAMGVALQCYREVIQIDNTTVLVADLS
jgi:serine/threonine protein phosphatase PrpC